MSTSNSKRICGRCEWSAMGMCARTAESGIWRPEGVDAKVESVREHAPTEKKMASTARETVSKGILKTSLPITLDEEMGVCKNCQPAGDLNT